MTVKLMMAYLHEHVVSHSWHESFVETVMYELGRGAQVTVVAERGVNGVLGESRNNVVDRFLASDADFLITGTHPFAGSAARKSIGSL